jgi:hypothetical protein
MLKKADRDSVTVKSTHSFSGRVTEVDIVGCYGDRRIQFTVADRTDDTQCTGSVDIEDARVLHAHLGRLIKRADRARQKERTAVA